MTAPVNRRLIVERLPGGSRKLTLRCPCARVSRTLGAWESEREAVAEMRAAHMRAAPRCPHRSPIREEVLT